MIQIIEIRKQNEKKNVFSFHSDNNNFSSMTTRCTTVSTGVKSFNEIDNKVR